MTAAALLGAALAALARPYGWLWLALTVAVAVLAVVLAVAGTRVAFEPGEVGDDTIAEFGPDAEFNREIQRLIEEGKRNG